MSNQHKEVEHGFHPPIYIDFMKGVVLMLDLVRTHAAPRDLLTPTTPETDVHLITRPAGVA